MYREDAAQARRVQVKPKKAAKKKDSLGLLEVGAWDFCSRDEAMTCNSLQQARSDFVEQSGSSDAVCTSIAVCRTRHPRIRSDGRQ